MVFATARAVPLLCASGGPISVLTEMGERTTKGLRPLETHPREGYPCTPSSARDRCVLRSPPFTRSSPPSGCTTFVPSLQHSTVATITVLPAIHPRYCAKGDPGENGQPLIFFLSPEAAQKLLVSRPLLQKNRTWLNFQGGEKLR